MRSMVISYKLMLAVYIFITDQLKVDLDFSSLICGIHT